MTNWYKPPFYIGDKIKLTDQNNKEVISSLRNSSEDVFTVKSVEFYPSNNFLITLEEQSFDTPLLASRFKRYEDTLKLSEGDTIMIPLKIKKIKYDSGMLITDNNVLNITLISINKLSEATGKKYKVEKKPKAGETWIYNPLDIPEYNNTVIILYSDNITTYIEYKDSKNRFEVKTSHFLKFSEFKS